MKVQPCALAEVLLLSPDVFTDERGFFLESFNERVFQALGLETRFVQDNHSRSAQGVLRGLHYQLRRPQGKLIRVVSGAIWDVAVDLRRSSASFGRSVALELRAEEGKMLWIPPGFAHGFLALSAQADVLYKVTEYYSPADERTVLWNDPDVAIAWPTLAGERILSRKDLAGKRLAEAEVYE